MLSASAYPEPARRHRWRMSSCPPGIYAASCLLKLKGICAIFSRNWVLWTVLLMSAVSISVPILFPLKTCNPGGVKHGLHAARKSMRMPSTRNSPAGRLALVARFPAVCTTNYWKFMAVAEPILSHCGEQRDGKKVNRSGVLNSSSCVMCWLSMA